MTLEDKTKLIVERVLEESPGLAKADVEKRTPQGQQVRELAAHCARAVFGQTGDKDYLHIARGFERGMDLKPVGAFETK